MSGCSCIYDGDGDGPEFYREAIRTARKEHKCGECHMPILPGQQYEYTFGTWEGKPGIHKTCIGCKQLRDHYFCEGWIYGQVIERVVEHFAEGGDTICCYDGLPPEAREVIENVAWPDVAKYLEEE